MANEFAEAPVLAEDFPDFPAEWVCPITGLVVPKDPDKNLEFRATIMEMAETDELLQRDLYTACSKSILYFMNMFCFTKRIFDDEEKNALLTVEELETHLPFVTWPIQDELMTKLEQCVSLRKSLLTDKSREMGATWCHIALYVHRLIFRSDEDHLLLSRKEDSVDKVGGGRFHHYPYGQLAAPGTLFGKLDYILNRLPRWMVPRMARTKMSIVNLDNNTRIEGESANATAGSSDRRHSIFLDEMAKMEHAESIKRSTKAVAKCRLVCSTPNGPGTTYSKWRMSGQIPVFILPWWEHPEKGYRRYTHQDELGRWKIRSPWYDEEAATSTPKELAIEVDMDHVGSGNTIFDAVSIEMHKKIYGRKPKRKVRIDFKKGTSDGDVVDDICKRNRDHIAFTPRGSWNLWCNLNHGRPQQNRTYTFGIDISMGQGASNSVISVMCDQTSEKVAEFADANTKPYELARIACAAAIWFGGTKLPFIVWENNGNPGIDFGYQLMTIYKYPSVYFDRNKSTVAQKRSKKYGWHSDQTKKAIGLGMLERAYALGGFINHSISALDEALTYIRYDGGGCGPADLLEESESARKTHGDRVIADMLCVMGTENRGQIRPNTERSKSEYSVGGRLKSYQRKRKASVKTKTFNFTK